MVDLFCLDRHVCHNPQSGGGGLHLVYIYVKEPRERTVHL